jgi:N-acetyl-alpha-D-muramate 1-phosphate uridylyltransferase
MQRDVGEAMFAVAILAGGLATRMRPVTERIPKSMIEVAGRPFIEHQLALLQTENVQNVVLCVGHLGEMIQAHIGDGKRFGLSVSYSFDGERLLGTGGALRRALPLLGHDFFVLYGDSYLDISYASVQAAYRDSGKPALMTVFRNESQWDTSNVLFDGTRVVRYDKRHPTSDMKFIDYGLGILSSDLLNATGSDAFDLSDIYAALAHDGRLAGFEATRRFYEIGTPSGLAVADGYLKGNQRS